MQFDDGRTKKESDCRPVQQKEGGTGGSSPLLKDFAGCGFGFDAESAVSPELMSLISRVAKYQARYLEGLFRGDGDHEKAITFAGPRPEGMTEDEYSQVLGRIESNDYATELLDALCNAADREVRACFDVDDEADNKS